MDLFRDRLLGISFLISVCINVLLVVLIGNSNIFGSTPPQPLVKLSRLAKPPIFVKPHKPPPPPPPPKVKPVVVQHPVITPQPTPTVRPTYVPHVFAAPTTNAVAPQPVVQQTAPAPPVSVPTAPSQVNVSTPVPPAPPPPPVVAPPAPHEVEAPPAPPPAPVKVAIPDRQDPLCLTVWPTDLSSKVTYDTASLLTTTVTVHFTVEPDGSVANVKFDQRTGNDDLDDLLQRVVEKSKWKPAVQDGVARQTKFAHTFDLEGS